MLDTMVNGFIISIALCSQMYLDWAVQWQTYLFSLWSSKGKMQYSTLYRLMLQTKQCLPSHKVITRILIKIWKNSVWENQSKLLEDYVTLVNICKFTGSQFLAE